MDDSHWALLVIVGLWAVISFPMWLAARWHGNHNYLMFRDPEAYARRMASKPWYVRMMERLSDAGGRVEP